MTCSVCKTVFRRGSDRGTGLCAMCRGDHDKTVMDDESED